MPLPRLPRKLGDMLSDKEPSESALTPVAAKVAIPAEICEQNDKKAALRSAAHGWERSVPLCPK